MKRNTITIILSVVFLLLSSHTFAQENSNAENSSWKVERKTLPSFIENQGQFKLRNKASNQAVIEFAYDGNHENFYFTKKGVVIELTHAQKRKKSPEEKAIRSAKKKQGFKDAAEFRAFEEVGHRQQIDEDDLTMHWLGANPNVEIVGEEKDDYYHSYSYYDEAGAFFNKNELASWKRLIYKNLYPNIDVIYEIHLESGFKYSLIVHPGADISKIKLNYSKEATLNFDGTISTATRFGDVLDHAPLTFYANNQKNIIKSNYRLENNIISFELGDYDPSQTIVIDPWTQMPNFPSSNWDCIWECERDGAGNVYVIGGTSPLQLLKYDALGALQWTYNTPYDTTEWLGTFATDLAGNSYVSNGSPAKIFKLNTAAGVVWNNTNPGGLLTLTEFWNITFNCDQTRLVIAGTDGGAFAGPQPYIFDIDLNTGNVLTSVKMHEGSLFNAQEVRSITPCNNGKYYYLSHDSIGWIHQSLTSCTQAGQAYRVDNGIDFGYKCEDWRYNNSGIMALAYYGGFVYLHKGNELQKRDFTTAAIVGTVAIPGGVFNTSFGGNNVGCSGIDIDDCGNIFVGSTNGVFKFDQNLTQLSSFPTSFTVYDVEVNTNGEIIVGGSTGNSGSGNRTGYVQTFLATNCAPQAVVCCDATICPQGALCINDTAVVIQVTTPGGIFSATCGSCIDSLTGIFNASIAGVGSHTITYTLPCGSETLVIPVNLCSAISVCEQPNGDLMVNGGTGPYNWSEWFPGGSTPITTQAQCVACGYTWFFGTCLNGVTPVTSCNTPAGWVPLATGQTIPAPSTYPVQVVDNAGTTFTVSGPGVVPPCAACPPLTVTTSAQVNVACFGDSTGSFSVSTVGGAEPYDYFLLDAFGPIDSIINATGLQTFSNLPAGNYNIGVLDTNNCPGLTSIIISQPASALTLAVDSTIDENCGLLNGAVFVTTGGGSPNYTYLWSNGATTEDITGIGAGSYQVTVTDANGCEVVSSSINVNNSSGLAVSIDSVQGASCNGSADGFIHLTTSGGTPGYTYLWSNGATTEDLSGLVVGSYQVTLTDATGCSITSAMITISEPTMVLVAIDSSSDVNCGASDGAVYVSVTGGTPGYTYLWSNGATTEDLIALSTSGNYIITVTDANGCTSTSNATIVTNSGMSGTAIVSNILCNGGNSGAIALTVSGGTIPYSYQWSNGGSTQNISGLTVGTYAVTVSDFMGCIYTWDTTLTAPTALVLSVDTSNAVSCFGFADGQLNSSISGGTGSYTFLWSNTATTQNISGLAIGSYTLTVTDGNGCTISTSTNISDANPILLTINLITDTLDCDQNPIGVLTAVATGGAGSFSYQWSNGETTASITGLDAGNYTVTATDNNACTSTSTATIYNRFVPSINAYVDAINQQNVSITLGDSVLVSAGFDETGNGVIYSWSAIANNGGNFGFDDSNVPTTAALPNASDVYSLTVTAMSADSCFVSDTLLVVVQSVFMGMPNAFTPNGDYVNDNFGPVGLVTSDIVEFKVFNRWGQLIYDNTDLSTGGWDGTYKGVEQPSEVYIYLLRYQQLGQDEKIMKGEFTLIR